jgi:hypothetical protein
MSGLAQPEVSLDGSKVHADRARPAGIQLISLGGERIAMPRKTIRLQGFERTARGLAPQHSPDRPQQMSVSN